MMSKPNMTKEEMLKDLLLTYITNIQMMTLDLEKRFDDLVSEFTVSKVNLCKKIKDFEEQVNKRF